MTLMSRLLQDNSCGKNSWKSIKYSQSYNTVCTLRVERVKPGKIHLTIWAERNLNENV